MGHTSHATGTMSRPCTSSTTMWASRFEITYIHICELKVLNIGTTVFILKSSISPFSLSYYISSIKYIQTASTLLAYVPTGNTAILGRTCLVDKRIYKRLSVLMLLHLIQYKILR